MSVELQRVLTLVLPILLGAIIGYLTNALAIRMLFRPFREIRVFGIRVPFTPGIIPRQRGALAESIASMVSKQLLTEEAVERHLRAEEFQRRLESEIASRTERLRSQGEESGEPFWVAPATSLIREGLRALADNPGTFETIERISSSLIDYGDRRTLEEIGLPHGLPLGAGAKRFGALLQEESRSRTLAEDMWEELDLGDKRLASLLPEGTVDFIAARLNALYEPAADRLVEGMRTPEIRRVMEIYGRRIVRMIINQMNLMQRLLVSAAQYDRQLNERMPVIVNRLVEELGDAIHHDAVREQLLKAGIALLKDILDSPLEELASRFDLDIPALLASAVRYAGGRLEESSNALEGLARRFHLGPEATVTELLMVLSARDREALVDAATTYAMSWLTQKDRRRRLEVATTRLLRRAFEGGAGVVSSLLRLEEPEHKAATDRRLAVIVTETIESFLPRALGTFDLRQMVVQRINSLDVREVERLLMQVIAQHLKWINVFGAVLGAFIGAMQLLLRLL
ncbi:MAG: DUF445 family protein [Alkalispirochaetaceae bacterium]